MSDEWGDWKEHDGRQRPVSAETFVQVRFRAPPDTGEINPWDDGALAGLLAWHHDGQNDDIVAYRIRKPRGLTILENLIADLPAPVRPEVDA